MRDIRSVKAAALVLMAAVVSTGIIATGASASQPKVELETGAFPVTFTGSGGTGLLEVTSEFFTKRTVICTENTSSGTVSNSTVLTAIKVVFKGCTATGPFGIKLNCNSMKAATGEIVAEKIEGRLFYITPGNSEAGIDFTPEGSTEFSNFLCGGIQTFVVTGSVVGKLTPVNGTFNTVLTLTFGQAGGHQIPEGYLASVGCGFTKDVLMTTGVGFEKFGPRQSGIEGTEKLTVSKKVKVFSTKCS